MRRVAWLGPSCARSDALGCPAGFLPLEVLGRAPVPVPGYPAQPLLPACNAAASTAAASSRLPPQILFPESYLRTAAWLREQAAANAEVLARCQAALEAAVAAQPRFGELAGGLVVAGRTKSLFSTLKKLLRLGNTAAGGRARAQLYDLMGLRVVVQPRADLPPVGACRVVVGAGGAGGAAVRAVWRHLLCSCSSRRGRAPHVCCVYRAQEEAEALAAQACYLVRDAAFELWQPVAGRCKDYIAAPKSNGYQSLHSTVRWGLGWAGGGAAADAGAVCRRVVAALCVCVYAPGAPG